MTRPFRRFVVALIVFAASGATQRPAHAQEDVADKACLAACTLATTNCYSSGGSEKFCAGFATGCMIGCKMPV